MPALKSLELGEIELQDNTWEAVIEFLTQSRHLSTFDIPYHTRLLYHDDSLASITQMFLKEKPSLFPVI